MPEGIDRANRAILYAQIAEKWLKFLAFSADGRPLTFGGAARLVLRLGNVWLGSNATDGRRISHNRRVAQLLHELLIAFAPNRGRVS
jgi:hypothetical protein